MSTNKLNFRHAWRDARRRQADPYGPARGSIDEDRAAEAWSAHWGYPTWIFFYARHPGWYRAEPHPVQPRFRYHPVRRAWEAAQAAIQDGATIVAP